MRNLLLISLSFYNGKFIKTKVLTEINIKLKKMKNKNLEALQEIAVKILKMNENTSAEELQRLSRKLYEALTVQLYLQNNTDKSDESLQEIPDKKETEQEPFPVEQPEERENLAEPLIEKIKDIVAQMPGETHQIDEMLETIIPKQQKSINDIEAFAATYQKTPVFERKQSSINEDVSKDESPQAHEKPKNVAEPSKKKSLNDKLTKNIQIGLNDRLAFTKHLFNGNAEDYNRVISQLTTLNSFEEANNFIDAQIKPDYNWEGKEAHLERFLQLIEKRFD